LEEVRARLGDDQTRALMESDDERNWLASYRSRNKIPPDKRRLLLETLDRLLKPEEVHEAQMLAAAADALMRHPAVLALLGLRPPSQ
jgi:hypothetical protein